MDSTAPNARRSRIWKDFSIKTIIPRSFQNTLLSRYPGLSKDPAYMKLATIALFSTHYEEDTNNLILPYGVCADIEGRIGEYENNHYCARNLLERFQKDVMTPDTFRWTEPNWKKNRARTIKVRWHPEISGYIENGSALLEPVLGNVYLATGRSCRYQDIVSEYEDRLEEARIITLERNPAGGAIIDYVNSRSKDIYARNFKKKIADTRSFVTENLFAPRKRVEFNTLVDIKRQVKPIYAPSPAGNTDRLFARNVSYMSLKRDTRSILTNAWSDYDLKYSQVAICAMSCGIDDVNEFLASGGDFWKYVFDCIGIDYSLRISNPHLFAELKKLIKKAVYSLLYGMDMQHVKWNLARNKLLKQYAPDVAERFSQCKLINSLFEGMQRRRVDVMKVGAGVTCFGRLIKIEVDEDGETNVNSILAQQAQAIELSLLLPVVDLAKATNQFEILVWCHDGFIIHYPDPRRRLYWDNKIIETVNQRAGELSIITNLVETT